MSKLRSFSLSILLAASIAGCSSDSDGESYPIENANLSQIQGLWSNRVVYPEGVDESVISFGSDGVMKSYDWLGDSYDQVEDCYYVDDDDGIVSDAEGGFISIIESDGEDDGVDVLYQAKLLDEDTLEIYVHSLTLSNSLLDVIVKATFDYGQPPTFTYEFTHDSKTSTVVFEYVQSTWAISSSVIAHDGLDVEDVAETLGDLQVIKLTRFDGTESDLRPTCGFSTAKQSPLFETAVF